jgi:hypothetical protein
MKKRAEILFGWFAIIAHLGDAMFVAFQILGESFYIFFSRNAQGFCPVRLRDREDRWN